MLCLKRFLRERKFVYYMIGQQSHYIKFLLFRLSCFLKNSQICISLTFKMLLYSLIGDFVVCLDLKLKLQLKRKIFSHLVRESRSYLFKVNLFTRQGKTNTIVDRGIFILRRNLGYSTLEIGCVGVSVEIIQQIPIVFHINCLAFLKAYSLLNINHIVSDWITNLNVSLYLFVCSFRKQNDFFLSKTIDNKRKYFKNIL